jgi:hypothetical protein
LAPAGKRYRIGLITLIIPVLSTRRGGFMFDSLADRIRQDERAEVNGRERAIRWIAITVISVLLFGGLYFAVRMLD